MVRDFRRFTRLDAAVDVRNEPHPRRVAAAIRVRVSRRELWVAQRAVRCPRGRSGSEVDGKHPAMSPLGTGLTVLVCTFGGALAGMWLRRLLPPQHVDA